jgi:general secretion pathway protein D
MAFRTGVFRLLLRRATAALGLAIAVAGCATTNAMRQGLTAEKRKNYDEAVIAYTRVLRAYPDNQEARVALERSRLRAAGEHFTRGRWLAATGKDEEALVEYGLAAELNPSSAEIEHELRDVRTRLRARTAVARDGKTDLQALIERTRDLPLSGFDLPQQIKMPASLMFRDASSRDVYATIARVADISLIFDSSFRASLITADVRNASLEDALNVVASATRTFIRVTAPNTVMVVPDTPARRREYEEQTIRTFYLSNADLKETMDLLRVTLDLRHIAPTIATNALTIQDTPEQVAAAAREIAAIDKARPEVVIDVELLEVDRTKLQEYGLQIASPGSAGIDGQVAAALNQTQTQIPAVSLQALTTLGSSGLILSNLSGLHYRLLKSDSNTRTLASPQLRTSDGVAAQARFGDRVPVPVTTFAPIATGGTPQQPITSYNYENIGVTIDVTPRIHHDDDVTLAVKIEVGSLETTTGFGGLPEFSTRQVNTVTSLRDGETSMLAGLIRDDETTLFEGIPGVSDLPGIGRLFAHRHTQADRSDVILTLTPHIVRVLDLTEANVRPFVVGRESVSPSLSVLEPSRTDEARPFASPLNLTGIWAGELASIPGTPRMTWTLTESGTSVTGIVQVILPNGLVVLNGMMTGTIVDSMLTYAITVPTNGVFLAPACSGQLTGSAEATPTTLTGTASPGTISCVLPISTISFVLTKP